MLRNLYPLTSRKSQDRLHWKSPSVSLLLLHTECSPLKSDISLVLTRQMGIVNLPNTDRIDLSITLWSLFFSPIFTSLFKSNLRWKNYSKLAPTDHNNRHLHARRTLTAKLWHWHMNSSTRCRVDQIDLFFCRFNSGENFPAMTGENFYIYEKMYHKKKWNNSIHLLVKMAEDWLNKCIEYTKGGTHLIPPKS